MGEPFFISRQELIRAFGFSATLVEELGSPDFICANRRWGFTYFYELARVEVFAEENAERIQQILIARPRRQERAQAATRRRMDETVEWSRTIVLCLEPIPPHALEHARRYFAPQKLTRELALLYIRLHYTNYLQCLHQTARLFGAREARVVLCERIGAMLNSILEAEGLASPSQCGNP